MEELEELRGLITGGSEQPASVGAYEFVTSRLLSPSGLHSAKIPLILKMVCGFLLDQLVQDCATHHAFPATPMPQLFSFFSLFLSPCKRGGC